MITAEDLHARYMASELDPNALLDAFIMCLNELEVEDALEAVINTRDAFNGIIEEMCPRAD